MSELEIAQDVAMCILWILTYTLVLFGTIKYKYPLISPVTQALIAPFEFAALLSIVFKAEFRVDYIFIAYLYWTLIEIAIIFVIIKNRYIVRRLVIPYVGIVILITIAMVYCIVGLQQMFFFSFLNTFMGVLAWLVFLIRKKDYPINALTLTIFIAKLIADIFAFLVYAGQGHRLTQLLCALLPILHIVFIVVHIKRKIQSRKAMVR